MGNLFPELRDTENNDRKLWDHLVIMSDFQLDVDFPCEVITAESLETKPDPVARLDQNVRYRHYGRMLPGMIAKAARMEDGEERMALVIYLAEHMKKLLLSVNKDGVDDDKVFRDIYEMSDGLINIDPATVKLHNYVEAPTAGGKKKKKK